MVSPDTLVSKFRAEVENVVNNFSKISQQVSSVIDLTEDGYGSPLTDDEYHTSYVSTLHVNDDQLAKIINTFDVLNDFAFITDRGVNYIIKVVTHLTPDSHYDLTMYYTIPGAVNSRNLVELAADVSTPNDYSVYLTIMEWKESAISDDYKLIIDDVAVDTSLVNLTRYLASTADVYDVMDMVLSLATSDNLNLTSLQAVATTKIDNFRSGARDVFDDAIALIRDGANANTFLNYFAEKFFNPVLNSTPDEDTGIVTFAASDYEITCGVSTIVPAVVTTVAQTVAMVASIWQPVIGAIVAAGVGLYNIISGAVSSITGTSLPTVVNSYGTVSNYYAQPIFNVTVTSAYDYALYSYLNSKLNRGSTLAMRIENPLMGVFVWKNPDTSEIHMEGYLNARTKFSPANLSSNSIYTYFFNKITVTPRTGDTSQRFWQNIVIDEVNYNTVLSSFLNDYNDYNYFNTIKQPAASFDDDDINCFSSVFIPTMLLWFLVYAKLADGVSSMTWTGPIAPTTPLQWAAEAPNIRWGNPTTWGQKPTTSNPWENCHIALFGMMAGRWYKGVTFLNAQESWDNLFKEWDFKTESTGDAAHWGWLVNKFVPGLKLMLELDWNNGPSSSVLHALLEDIITDDPDWNAFPQYSSLYSWSVSIQYKNTVEPCLIPPDHEYSFQQRVSTLVAAIAVAGSAALIGKLATKKMVAKMRLKQQADVKKKMDKFLESGSDEDFTAYWKSMKKYNRVGLITDHAVWNNVSGWAETANASVSSAGIMSTLCSDGSGSSFRTVMDAADSASTSAATASSVARDLAAPIARIENTVNLTQQDTTSINSNTLEVNNRVKKINKLISGETV